MNADYDDGLPSLRPFNFGWHCLALSSSEPLLLSGIGYFALLDKPAVAPADQLLALNS